MSRWVLPVVATIMLLTGQTVAAHHKDALITGSVHTLRDLAGTNCTNPEGIAASRNGTLFTAGLSGNICLIDSQTGAITGVIPVPRRADDLSIPVNLLGLLFVPGHTLFVADIADFSGTNKGRVLKVNIFTHEVAELARGFAKPNAFAMDRRGRLFVSDSAGSIWTVNTREGGATEWLTHSLLATSGSPPFGANGLAFDRSGRSLFVANTGDHRILRIGVNRDGSAGAISIFADGPTLDAALGTTSIALSGADGIVFDSRGNLWVCANQVNEVQVLSPSGALIQRFSGSGSDAMNFPASPVFLRGSLFVANLALNNPGLGHVTQITFSGRLEPPQGHNGDEDDNGDDDNDDGDSD